MFCFIFGVLGMEPRALHIQHSTLSLKFSPSPWPYFLDLSLKNNMKPDFQLLFDIFLTGHGSIVVSEIL
jgi:hypothetical protein